MMDKQVCPELQLNHLRAIKVLGKGATGTVFLVHHLISDPSATSPFALKVIEKSSKLNTDRRARWELSVLHRLNSTTSHPFLPTLLGSFETNDLIGWAIPYCPGGDLNVLRYNQSDQIFSPAVIKFYVAEIICALEKLHALGIVYRDLKPENVLIQQSGHVTLTDFDLSRTLIKSTRQHDFVYEDTQVVLKHNNNKVGKKNKNARVAPVSRRKNERVGERSNSFVGTEEYISPEVVRGEGHEFAVDWWALGVLAFEMMYGTTPFKGKNKKDTFRRIVMMSPEFIGRQTTLTDLIRKLLEKDPTRRLGYRRGACEIKEHPFFYGLKWDLLTELSRPPFLPSRELPELKEVKGIDITEYFEKLRMPPLSLDSPECLYNVSLTEF